MINYSAWRVVGSSDDSIILHVDNPTIKCWSISKPGLSNEWLLKHWNSILTAQCTIVIVDFIKLFPLLNPNQSVLCDYIFKVWFRIFSIQMCNFTFQAPLHPILSPIAYDQWFRPYVTTTQLYNKRHVASADLDLATCCVSTYPD